MCCVQWTYPYVAHVHFWSYYNRVCIFVGFIEIMAAFGTTARCWFYLALVLCFSQSRRQNLRSCVGGLRWPGRRPKRCTTFTKATTMPMYPLSSYVLTSLVSYSFLLKRQQSTCCSWLVVRCCLLHSGYLHTFNLKRYLGVILFTWPVVFVLFDTSNMPVCIQSIIGYTMQVFAIITLVLWRTVYVLNSITM